MCSGDPPRDDSLAAAQLGGLTAHCAAPPRMRGAPLTQEWRRRRLVVKESTSEYCGEAGIPVHSFSWQKGLPNRRIPRPSMVSKRVVLRLLQQNGGGGAN